MIRSLVSPVCSRRRSSTSPPTAVARWAKNRVKVSSGGNRRRQVRSRVGAHSLRQGAVAIEEAYQLTQAHVGVRLEGHALLQRVMEDARPILHPLGQPVVGDRSHGRAVGGDREPVGVRCLLVLWLLLDELDHPDIHGLTRRAGGCGRQHPRQKTAVRRRCVEVKRNRRPGDATHGQHELGFQVRDIALEVGHPAPHIVRVLGRRVVELGISQGFAAASSARLMASATLSAGRTWSSRRAASGSGSGRLRRNWPSAPSGSVTEPNGLASYSSRRVLSRSASLSGSRALRKSPTRPIREEAKAPCRASSSAVHTGCWLSR